MRGLIRSCLGSLVLVTAAPAPASGFVNFESGQVRPLALTPDGSRLLAVNTPDHRLAIYDVDAAGLVLVADVPVGLEPVAVAARVNSSGRTEAWVVNHLSDSVSVVELDPADVRRSRVVRTLLVGDEPRDLVFGGTARERAFITTAHRGQHRTHSSLAAVPGAGDPELTTPGIGRADVWVFDAESPGAGPGGTPLGIVVLFADTPRGLAVSPDGATVYAAAFKSGNQTTAIFESPVSQNGGVPPFPSGSTPGAPPTGLIVKFNPATGSWEDERGADWSAAVPFTLPDFDVFRIDADASPPAEAAGPSRVAGVGTVLFNLAVRPSNGKLYVTNLELFNQIRFVPLIPDFPSSGELGGVAGRVAHNRISVIEGTTPTPVALNPHIDFGVTPGPASEIAQSVALPVDLVFSPSGATLFVAFLGSDRVVAYDADALEAGLVSGASIAVPGGPSGLALDAAHDRLYVMSRFTQQISIIRDATNPAARALWKTVDLPFNPEPPEVRNGRRFLYDASASGHGSAACASCHIFGDTDDLPWDLGDPFGALLNNPNPFLIGTGTDFHPLKGPMTVQSLRGLASHGPMHWRGDQTGGNDPGGDALDEDAAFQKFQGGFTGPLGAATGIPEADMQAYTDFILSVRYPPNPIRALDDVPTPEQSAGESVFVDVASDVGVISCNFCHALPTGGTGQSSFDGEPQDFKIPHLRNMYQKVGMFAAPGPQVRGSGFLHDGSVATLKLFVASPVFQLDATQEDQLEQFMLALDTGLKPIVGQQVSATASTFSDPDVTARIDLMIAQDEAGSCDLVVKGVNAGLLRGWLYAGAHSFQTDRQGETMTKAAVRNLAATAEQEQVYTCVPPGSGTRIGIDHDEDSVLDFDDPCPTFPNTLPLNGGASTDPNGDPNGDRIPTECQCGDLNLNGLIDSQDAIFAFNCIPPAAAALVEICDEAQAAGIGDGNNNGLYDLQDAILLFNAQPGGGLASWSLRCRARPSGAPPN